MEKIYHKLDWYTCMFGDTSFRQILDWVGLDSRLYEDEFLSNRLDVSQGLEDKFAFFYEGVSLWVSRSDYIIAGASWDTCFDVPYSRVRLDVSGSGLDFLRHIGIDVDTHFRDIQKYPQSFNITRADFAFDLVDYEPEFLNQLISYCETNATPSGRICLLGRPSGLALSINKGRQLTCYLGAPKGKQTLRVYDKRLQYFDPDCGCYTKPNPYDNPDSWIRVELQSRRERAHELLFAESDNYWLSIFKYIHDYYCFADVENTNSHNRVSHDFWDKLWDWEKIPRIIQNENCVQFVPYGERIIGWGGRNIYQIIKFLATLDKLGGREYVQQYISSAMRSLYDYDDIRKTRPRERFHQSLNVLVTEDYVNIADSYEECKFGLYRDCGVLDFKL